MRVTEDDTCLILDSTPTTVCGFVPILLAAAGIYFDAKFMGLRHGGNAEGGDAELTDAHIRAHEMAHEIVTSDRKGSR
jgi:hypothetical protein